MNVKKQQMQLHLEQQQQPPQRRHNRTGFETLLDQSQAQAADNSQSTPDASHNTTLGCGSALQQQWSTPDNRHQHRSAHPQNGRYDSLQQGATPFTNAPADFPKHQPTSPLSPATSTAAKTTPTQWPTNGIPGSPVSRSAEEVTTPTSPSQLSLPSPYYDRNPIIGFPLHYHQQHHHHHRNHGVRSPVSVTSATIPLANVQNVAYPGDQDHNDHLYANNAKYYQRHHQHQINYKSTLTDGQDDDKENIKQRDTECLQQQLDEVLKACVDYEERNKNRQQQPASAESSGNTAPPLTTTPPQQNRIKTNGSLPRDSSGKKPSSPTPSMQFSTVASPTSPLSITSPLSQPSSVTWPTDETPSLSPLSLHAAGADGGSDSVFSENDNVSTPPSSATSFQPTSTQLTNACGSPRSRIRTLVQSGPITTTIATITTTITTAAVTGTDTVTGGSVTAAADSHLSSGNDHRIQNDRPHSRNGCSSEDGLKISTANLLLSKLPERSVQKLSSASLQSAALQPQSWQTTTSTWLRSSPFSANGPDNETPPEYTGSVSGAATEAAEQRRKLLVELSAFKSRLVELHLRREEVDRELIIETALLHAELNSADNETRQSENIVDGLDRAVAECRQQMDVCTVKQQEQRAAADLQLASHRRTLQGLRSRLESIEDNDVLKAEIRASIDQQTELLDAEQKLYEDVEFGLLEEEAGWLARREELHRDRAAAVAVRRARRARAEWLRAQLDQLRSVGDDQLRVLRADINTVTLSIQQGHKKLQELDAAIGATTANSAQDHYRRQQFQYNSNYSSTAEQQQPKSLEWTWDQRLKSPMSPVLSSSFSWDQQSKSPVSPWSTTSSNNAGFPSSSPYMETVTNNSLMTSSMTTTCCSSIASSGGEDDGCRLPSDDSTSRMSMSTIFDGRAEIKLRSKIKSPSDITKRPLTRYLPIRYDGDSATENSLAFDLRAHIESAGHQLDDDGTTDNHGVDRHFWIDSSSCRGYLKKLSGTGGKNSRRSGRKWLKRWFVFDRQSRTLSYYHRRSDDVITVDNRRAGTPEKKPRPRVSIRFQDIQEVYVDHTNSSKGLGCAFVVKTANRTFYLSAATGQAVRVWVDVIFTGAEGYREYLKTSIGDGAGSATVQTGNDSHRVQ